MYEGFKKVNPSTLSGAIDIIVVQQRDGTFKSTPFHVRFGKIHLLSPTSKTVFISINGERIQGVEMKLNQAGEAGFVRGTQRISITRAEQFLQTPTTPDLVGSPTTTMLTFNSTSSQPTSVSSSEMLSSFESSNSTASALTASAEQQISNSRSGDRIEIARCKNLLKISSPTEASELFDQHALSFNEFQQMFTGDSNALYDNDIVFRINGSLYPWIIAGPMILSNLIFNQPLSMDTISVLQADYMARHTHLEMADDTNSTENESENQQQANNGWLLNFFFNKNKPSPAKDIVTKSPPTSPSKAKPSLSNSLPNSPTSFLSTSFSSSFSSAKPTNSTGNATSTTPNSGLSRFLAFHEDEDTSLSSRKVEPEPVLEITCDAATSQVNPNTPTSEDLEAMNLSKGPNQITFQVLGSDVLVSSTIYLWDMNDKVVISDIDGTITKSDVFGHILPNVFGEDWTQTGVAQFYTNIRNNGYQLLYLTARALGQAEITKSYLQNINQLDISNKEMRLPDGPVFMSPNRVFESIKREVILRCPEQFKVACLKEISQLFEGPVFYAGFGNRESDRFSYKEVGIATSRIFIIDEHGEIDNGGAKKQSYSSLNEIVDEIFPAIGGEKELVFDDSFNDFNYWKPNATTLGGNLADIEAEIKQKERERARK